MELAQIHSHDPIDAGAIRRVLRELLPPNLLNPWGALGVATVGPWRPADVWPGAPELLLWTTAFELPGDALLNDEGLRRFGAGIIGRRGAPVHPAEHVVGRLGAGLVLLHSDAGRYAYSAVYRERHLRFSLMLIDGERSVRCDGQEVIVEVNVGKPSDGVATAHELAGTYRDQGRLVREPYADEVGGITTGVLAIRGTADDYRSDHFLELGNNGMAVMGVDLASFDSADSLATSVIQTLQI